MFGLKKRRKTDQADVDLPITPMLDMAFQLMAFFVFTFRPQPQEGQISMYLPRSDGSEVAVAIPPPDADPLEVKEEYRVQVYSANGAIGSITFIDEIGSQELGNTPQALFQKLKSIAISGKDKPKIKIESADNLVYSQLIALMDACIAAGFEQVGVAPLVEATDE